MDLGTARDQVYGRLGVTQTDGQLTPQSVTGLLRVALNYIAGLKDWEWLQETETLSTTLGVNTLTPLSASASGVTWARTTNLAGSSTGYYVTQIPWQEFRVRDPHTQGEFANVWAVYGGLIYLHPTPSGSSASYFHDFQRGESSLTSDTDTPLLPDQFCGAWVEKAAELAARRTHDYPTAQICSGEFDNWLKVIDENRRRTRGPYRVAVRPGGFM